MVTEFAYPLAGGVPEHVHFLSRELVRLGHDVTVVTGRLGRDTQAHDSALQRAAGYRVARVGRSAPVYSNGSLARVSLGIGLKPRLRRILAEMDVVHAQGLATPVLPLLALRASRAPVTTGTFHTYFDASGKRLYRLFFHYVRSALARMDRRIAVSQPCIDAIAPVFPGHFDIIPNGIDCEIFRPLRDGEARPAGPPRILFVGRFDPRNALDVLLAAAAILKSRGVDFAVDIVGDGPTRQIYHRQARGLGIEDRLTWHGLLVAGRERLYREATVFAAPCTKASFGVVLLEALASGTPVVCADNVGFREVIRDGVPGVFVPPRDPLALADALEAILADPALCTDWGRRGREDAERLYAWPAVARRVEALYEDVLAGKAPLRPTATR